MRELEGEGGGAKLLKISDFRFPISDFRRELRIHQAMAAGAGLKPDGDRGR